MQLAGAQEFDSSQNELLSNHPSRRVGGQQRIPAHRNWETEDLKPLNEAVAQIRPAARW